jgi:uncharacterized membrane protein
VVWAYPATDRLDPKIQSFYEREELRNVATLTVWKFDSAGGAEEAVGTLSSLASQELVKVHDAAMVSWEEGKKKPKTTQLNDLVGAGTFGGAFWGLLFGLIFFVPILGMVVGAATGAMSGALKDVGIDDRFIDDVRARVTPGTSALFVLTSDAVVDKVKEAFAGHMPELLFTNMDDSQEQALREAFSD